ncbi:hypothetical protein NJT12_05175 [Flavobacterium sp. AC]|uniref:Lipoprotein n=1 Tax=Flavobacterium azizsancarii TaxID=2961580 RepID=A0ABT4W8Y2_9FLAO|nr:hypothetical protein [Flavobacterium azizsancarii]MDA6069008.1 hypothetical protein [Flavobacterium azizsancarii]
MKFFKSYFSILGLLLLTGCVGNMNPTGGNSSPNYPYFITAEPLEVKKIMVPKGTKLVYEEQFFKEGKQDKMLSEEKLITIEFPTGQPIIWGGVPVTSINKFFNSEMHGFTVYADFEKLSADKKTKFSQLWQSCSNDLGITVKNIGDWSFNTENISDVDDCSVLYQRYFKNNKRQQDFLDEIYSEMLKVGSK